MGQRSARADSFWDYPFTWERALWWLIRLATLPLGLILVLPGDLIEWRFVAAARRAERAGESGFIFAGEYYEFWKPSAYVPHCTHSTMTMPGAPAPPENVPFPPPPPPPP